VYRDIHPFKPWGEPGAGLVKIEQASGLMDSVTPRQRSAVIPIGINIRPLGASKREVPGTPKYATGGKSQPDGQRELSRPPGENGAKGTATSSDKSRGGWGGFWSSRPLPDKDKA